MQFTKAHLALASAVASAERATLKATSALKAALDACDTPEAREAVKDAFKLAVIAVRLKFPVTGPGLVKAAAVRDLKGKRTLEQEQACGMARTRLSRALADIRAEESGIKPARKPRQKAAGTTSAAQGKIEELETQLYEREQQLKIATQQVPKLASPGATTEMFQAAVAALELASKKNPGKFLGKHREALRQIAEIVAALDA